MPPQHLFLIQFRFCSSTGGGGWEGIVFNKSQLQERNIFRLNQSCESCSSFVVVGLKWVNGCVFTMQSEGIWETFSSPIKRNIQVPLPSCLQTLTCGDTMQGAKAASFQLWGHSGGKGPDPSPRTDTWGAACPARLWFKAVHPGTLGKRHSSASRPSGFLPRHRGRRPLCGEPGAE